MINLRSDGGVTVYVTKYRLETYIRKILKWRISVGFVSMFNRKVSTLRGDRHLVLSFNHLRCHYYISWSHAPKGKVVTFSNLSDRLIKMNRKGYTAHDLL